MILSLSLVFFASAAIAGPGHDHSAKVAPEFESMKALVGTWEGKTTMNGKEESVTTTFKLTSGGTALVETMNPGTPHEMVTVYSSHGKKVQATHYCAMGNQPHLSLKSAKDNVFAFEMKGNDGIANKNDMHMRAVTITVDGNKLKEEWTNFEKGKKAGMHAFEFTKKM